MPVELTELPSRVALAAWLELEAALIEATAYGSAERRQLKVVAIASRPNDNDHVTTARRIAQQLRDPDVTLSEVLDRVHGSRHFRAAVHHVVARLLGKTAQAGQSIREAYLAGMPLPNEGEPEFLVERATDLEADAPVVRYKGPPAESVIDTSDPAWMIAGADDVYVIVRTDQGVFEVPSASLKKPAREVSTVTPSGADQ